MERGALARGVYGSCCCFVGVDGDGEEADGEDAPHALGGPCENIWAILRTSVFTAVAIVGLRGPPLDEMPTGMMSIASSISSSMLNVDNRFGLEGDPSTAVELEAVVDVSRAAGLGGPEPSSVEALSFE